MTKYEENLISGGKLVVTDQEWYIEYYFSGPDLRYSGEIIRIKSSQLNDYITAYEENYKEYKRLLTIIPKGGEFEIKGELGMNIGVGSIKNGVTISRWYNHLRNSCFPINTEDKLEKVIFDYLYCTERAEKLKETIS
jgi:hypothetical protein